MLTLLLFLLFILQALEQIRDPSVLNYHQQDNEKFFVSLVKKTKNQIIKLYWIMADKGGAFSQRTVSLECYIAGQSSQAEVLMSDRPPVILSALSPRSPENCTERFA